MQTAGLSTSDDFDWIIDNLDEIGVRLAEHVQMTVLAVAIGRSRSQ